MKAEIDVHLLLSREFASEFTRRLGYDFDTERIDRIADEAREAIKAGATANEAYAHAVDMELVMYGDPNSKVVPIGILGVTS